MKAGTLTALAGLAASAAAALGQTCKPHWEATFVGSGLDGGVQALAVVEDDLGPAVYVGGRFSTAGGLPTGVIARWDGASWSALGQGIPAGFNSHGFIGCCSQVFSIAQGPAGSPATVHVAGDFIEAGGLIAESIADWRGGAWHDLAGGVANTGCVDCAFRVYAVLRHQGVLYATGTFDLAGGQAAARVARWDGSAWAPVGDGLGAAPSDPFPTWGQALAVYNESPAASLFVGGRFSLAGSVETQCIARWDGQQWTDVGGGFETPKSGATPSVAAMAVYDDGSGPALYVGGTFQRVGGRDALNLARWNGSEWAEVGGGVGRGPNDQVLCLAVFDDGRGPALYVGGQFEEAGGVPAANIARWDGTAWEALDEGVAGGEVRAMTPYEDASGPTLLVGGWFSTAGTHASPYLAKWAGCAGGCYANCDGSTQPPVLNVNDFICFQASFAAGASYANCDGSTQPPVLSVNDFICFQARFAGGCG